MNWNTITSNPKLLFLIDGIGAILSAFSLGILLVQFETWFGMPKSVLYFLAIIPCFFAVYSFSSFSLFPKSWRLLLKIIAIANLSYCLTTIGLMIYFFQELTILGFGYFLIEIIIIVTLVSFEFKVANSQ